MAKRAAVFVDGSNFFKYCEELHIYAYQLEWDLLIPDIVMDREIVYAKYYDCPKNDQEVPDQAQRQKQFFSIMRAIPWMELCFGRLEPRYNDAGQRHLVEKAVDVQIAVDMVLGAYRDEYDHAFLLSADGDFTPAVAAAQEMGKRVYIATPGKSFQLGQAANTFIRLDSHRLNNFLRRHGGP